MELLCSNYRKKQSQPVTFLNSFHNITFVWSVMKKMRIVKKDLNEDELKLPSCQIYWS